MEQNREEWKRDNFGRHYSKGIKMDQSLAQQAYHTWLTSLYGTTGEAFTKGVKTWDALPSRAQQAWEVTVEFIAQDALVQYLKVTGMNTGETKVTRELDTEWIKGFEDDTSTK